MRARNIKPGLYKNELLGKSDPLNTVIFTGLWGLADREGRLEDRPSRIHVEVNPYRPEASTVQALDWLCAREFIVRYRVAGVDYIWIPEFLNHQHPHVREPPSKLPPVEKAESDQRSRKAQGLHGASLVPDTGEHQSGPGISGLIPDSGFRIPDSSPSESSTPQSSYVAQPRDGPVERIFEFWRQTWKHPRAKLDRKRHRVIALALKSYSEADLKSAIAGYLNSPHHCGDNERHTVYDDIGLFLRDAAHIDAGLAFGQGRANGAVKPELQLRSEAEYRAYIDAVSQGHTFTTQAEWEEHYRARQTH